MRLLVTGATTTLRQLAPTCSDVLGCLPTPLSENTPQSIAELRLPVAADNGCFNGFNSNKFVRMLNVYREAEVKLEWVTVPDVVGNAEQTFKQWGRWHKVVLAFGFRPCLVLQDGCTWHDLEALKPPSVFVGGSTRWKLGIDARKCVKWARELDKPAHMGRVNSLKRIRYAVQIGCTSCDGSGFSKWPEQKIPWAVKWIREAMRDMKTPNLFTTIGGES